MGRAPATALAYMNWIRHIPLDEAFKLLTSLRRCGPKVEAIRSALCDLLLGNAPVESSITVTREGTAQRVQIAGLDFGWNNPQDMVRDPKTKHFAFKRDIYPGAYQYKLIVDGHWTYSADHPTAKDGENINNVLEVIPRSMDMDAVQKQVRYLSEDCRLTADEKDELVMLLSPWRK
mmetsp:Transcript_2128/g.3418  ORF Transcript_2128/g.3418 Transcript_2128/m.3418 type:complete len:176 (-) Transcript_2128:222-749(-)